ncbi:hypothetical protein [Chengkuizengella axinellae]|uniref:Uncharacterized protein n=1 Tax=Chengkuizengella axinellae TaxID=3064388 RepID=A0ABT9J560_9BACL|nr:hypothetical protein [Chengkuizengella sp. 2205SS18-9]MDP5276761.1 hypothetical protein [Chengkuizengella sp. 2205SS18-9]
MKWIRNTIGFTHILLGSVLLLNKLSLLFMKLKRSKRNAVKVFDEQLKKDEVPLEVREVLTNSYEQMLPLELKVWKQILKG